MVQNPLNVRAALPRRLRSGDQLEAGVVIINLDNQARSVKVRVESDLLAVKERPEKQVSVKPGDSLEVAFRLQAFKPGRARLTFTVDSEVLKEKLSSELAVEQSLVAEAFSISGWTDGTGGTGTEAIRVPDRFLGAGDEGLRISLDSTLASALIPAIRFLDLYPYDCLEQRTSKLFAYVLYDWLLPELRELKGREGRALVEAELEALAGYHERWRRFLPLGRPSRPDLRLLREPAHRSPSPAGPE